MPPLHHPRVTALVVAVLLATTAACGDTGSAADATRAETAASGSGDWLLRFTTAGGADGEQLRAVYVTFDPTTGDASTRTLPAVTGSDAGQDEQLLLVSADHRWAVPDTGVSKTESRSGKLVLYSVSTDATQALDIRAVTGEPTLQARAWAFDPQEADLLRVVDSERRVWRVDLAADSATREGDLPKRSGWIFGNGFDTNTGEPYIESIDSDETDPAGNGDLDSTAVQRQGGSLVRYDGDELEGLPKPPCGFAGGFRADDGAAWLFCADTPSIAAYALAQDEKSWEPYGARSPKVVPAGAVEMTFALPPLS
jgi:hypothetical protein